MFKRLAVVMACGGLWFTATGHGVEPQARRVAVNGISIDLVSIPAGDFTMGSATGDAIEQPPHRVHVAAFELARTEVTVRLFRAFVEATGYKTQAERDGASFARDVEGAKSGRQGWRRAPVSWRSPGFAQSDDDPVVVVSWDDAVAFCNWLAEQTGQPIRLPSEAEWEYACRAGSTSDLPANLDEVAWYADNSNGRTHPVATKKPNAFGLHDMHGNGWEWCDGVWQRYEGAPDGGPDYLNNPKLDLASLRPLRGGAWGLMTKDYRSGDVRASSRVPYPRAQSCNNSGFRVACGKTAREKSDRPR